ncbi:MAG: phosphotransferase [Chloroflexi bacterium]|nr:phosphotransferase [Chloroflexota bacterium]
MADVLAAPSLLPQVSLPDDPNLGDFPYLFSGEWVWRAYCASFGSPAEQPHALRFRQLSYNPGRSAVATYVVEWHWEDFATQEQFAVELARDRPARLFRYPDDRYLPGLKEVAAAIPACNLLNRYVFATSVSRVRVSLVRYRPAGHAVLRHRVGHVRFYVRAMRLNRLPRLLKAGDTAGQTDFVIPRLAGSWAEGGVVWLSEIPGKNLRRLVRTGQQPDFDTILENLSQLWEIPFAVDEHRPFNLRGAYRRARRVFRHVLRDHDVARQHLRRARSVLDPFVESWRPSSLAHNDFYDDQLIQLPDSKVALVDFEETGLGDPLLDVGNFLAHMLWSATFGGERESKASGEYYARFRAAALARFGWDERELNLREAVCIFRVCTNPVRHLAPDWPHRVERGLSLVNEVLER